MDDQQQEQQQMTTAPDAAPSSSEPQSGSDATSSADRASQLVTFDGSGVTLSPVVHQGDSGATAGEQGNALGGAGSPPQTPTTDSGSDLPNVGASDAGGTSANDTSSSANPVSPDAGTQAPASNAGDEAGNDPAAVSGAVIPSEEQRASALNVAAEPGFVQIEVSRLMALLTLARNHLASIEQGLERNVHGVVDDIERLIGMRD